MQQDCHFIATVKLDFKPVAEEGSGSLLGTSITLKLSENLDYDYYFKAPEEGLFRKPAIQVLTQAFVQGLIANVKTAHHADMWKEADHMRYIIDELGKSFATVTDDPVVGKIEV